jgi:hypothetical protein
MGFSSFLMSAFIVMVFLAIHLASYLFPSASLLEDG